MAITQVGLVGPFGLSNNDIGKQILQILIGSYGTSGSLDGSPSLTEAASMEFGGSSSELIADTSAHATGTVFLIYALEETVINTLTAATGYAETGYDAATIPAGTQIYGRYSSIQLTSGRVIVYRI